MAPFGGGLQRHVVGMVVCQGMRIALGQLLGLAACGVLALRAGKVDLVMAIREE